MRLFYLFLLALFAIVSCQPANKTADSTLILWSEPALQLQLTPAAAPVETPLRLDVSGTGLVNVNGELSGVAMYMGNIPLRFSKKNNSWQAEFLLGACTDPAMLWQIELELHFADGKKRMIKQQFHSSWQ